MATTIQDIAAKLGLSHVTVSNVLRNTGRVGADTRKKVAQVAREMGYRPQAHAKALRSGRFGCVGLLLTTEAGRSTLTEGMVCGIHDVLAAQNQHLIITRLPDETLSREGVVPKTLRESMVDGFLVNYTDHIPQKMRQLINAYRLPVIWLNVEEQHDCVRPDDDGAGRDATLWLQQRGHRRILYLDYRHTADGMAEHHYSARAREQGYRRSMDAAGLTARVVRTSPLLYGAEMEAHLRSWLTGEERPTAVLTYSEYDAEVVVVMARLMGLRVPEDIEVVAFADRLIHVAGHALPTWMVPQQAVGAEAARLLMQKIEQKNQKLPVRVVPFSVLLVQNTRTLMFSSPELVRGSGPLQVL